MATKESIDAVLSHEGYMGLIYVVRDDAGTPVAMHVVRQRGGALHYYDNRYSRTILKPRDRATATVIVEDDARERQAAMIDALKADRWANVIPRP